MLPYIKLYYGWCIVYAHKPGCRKPLIGGKLQGGGDHTAFVCQALDLRPTFLKSNKLFSVTRFRWNWLFRFFFFTFLILFAWNLSVHFPIIVVIFCKKAIYSSFRISPLSDFPWPWIIIFMSIPFSVFLQATLQETHNIKWLLNQPTPPPLHPKH